MIAGNVIAFVVCLPLALQGFHATPVDLAVLIYLGVFQIALAYALLTRSMREVPGLEAATLLLIEPVLNPIWTWIVHGERPGALALVGGVLIVTAAFAGTAWQALEARAWKSRCQPFWRACYTDEIVIEVLFNNRARIGVPVSDLVVILLQSSKASPIWLGRSAEWVRRPPLARGVRQRCFPG